MTSCARKDALSTCQRRDLLPISVRNHARRADRFVVTILENAGNMPAVHDETRGARTEPASTTMRLDPLDEKLRQLVLAALERENPASPGAVESCH